MSGSLVHSPADIVRRALVTLGLGTLPTASGSWPIAVSQEPDTPDEAITLYDTSGRIDGRTHVDGEIQEFPGLQVRVRSANPVTGYTKAQAIAVALDQSIRLTNVTIGANVYKIYAITRTGTVNAIGKEIETSKRNLFTINAVASIRQTT